MDIVVYIGNSGSGKSTLVARQVWLFERRGLKVFVVSPDEIRQEMCGAEIDQTRNAEVWKEAHERLRTVKTDVMILDATNVNPDQRQAVLEICRQRGNVFGVYVKTPLDVCIARQAGRTRQVPAYALERMQGQLDTHPPCQAEGFTVLYTIEGETFSKIE